MFAFFLGWEVGKGAKMLMGLNCVSITSAQTRIDNTRHLDFRKRCFCYLDQKINFFSLLDNAVKTTSKCRSLLSLLFIINCILNFIFLLKKLYGEKNCLFLFFLNTTELSKSFTCVYSFPFKIWIRCNSHTICTGPILCEYSQLSKELCISFQPSSRKNPLALRDSSFQVCWKRDGIMLQAQKMNVYMMYP